jgi:hypothetical protein
VNHTGGHSPSQVSNRLRSVGHVTSGSSPQLCIVGPGLPPGPSFRGVLPRFRGHEGRSVPLPADAKRSQFGTVSDRAYRQAVTRLSWLSYSPSDALFRSPAPVTGRSLPLPAESSPRRPGWTDLTRLPPDLPQSGYGPGPLGGICTLLDDCGLDSHRGQSLSPLVRGSENRTPSDRTSGLLRPRLLPYEGSMSGQDYADEPPSNRTNTSPRIRLYGSAPVRVVNSAPLAEVVSLGLPGGAAHLCDVSNAPRL